MAHNTVMHSLVSPPWADLSQPKHQLLHDVCVALPSARLVGGCVRDALLGRQPTDFDLATPLIPDEISSAFRSTDIVVRPLRRDHGIMLACRAGMSIEIATLRRDVETDGRHAVVSFTTSWAEDAARRDFTLNSLSATWEGAIFDPLDSGLEDAQAGRIRFVGDSETRIREDRLRVLRFIRFTTSHGNGVVDQGGFAACQICVPELENLSRERIWMELRRMLALPEIQAQGCLDLIKRLDAASVVIGYDVNPATQFAESCPNFETATVMARLVAGLKAHILPQTGPSQIASDLVQRFRLSRSETQVLSAALDWEALRGPSPDSIRLARLERSAEEVIAQLLVWRNKALLTAEQSRGLIAQAQMTPPDFPLSGHDLSNFAKGPALGALIDVLKQEWARTGYRMSAKQLLDRAEGGDVRARSQVSERL